MTVTTVATPTSYVGDGVTLVFPVVWPVASVADIKVEELVTSTGAVRILPTSDYSVQGDAVNGFNVVLTVAPPVGTTITLIRQQHVDQPQALRDHVRLPASTIEHMADRRTMQMQDVAATANRGLRLPAAEQVQGGMVLPAASARARSVLAFSDDGTEVNPIPTGDIEAVAAALADPGSPLNNLPALNNVASDGASYLHADQYVSTDENAPVSAAVAAMFAEGAAAGINNFRFGDRKYVFDAHVPLPLDVLDAVRITGVSGGTKFHNTPDFPDDVDMMSFTTTDDQRRAGWLDKSFEIENIDFESFNQPPHYIGDESNFFITDEVYTVDGTKTVQIYYPNHGRGLADVGSTKVSTHILRFLKQAKSEREVESGAYTISSILDSNTLTIDVSSSVINDFVGTEKDAFGAHTFSFGLTRHPLYKTRSALIKVQGIRSASARNCSIKNRFQYGFAFTGIETQNHRDLFFDKCGKRDNISSPLQLMQAGNVRGITKARRSPDASTAGVIQLDGNMSDAAGFGGFESDGVTPRADFGKLFGLTPIGAPDGLYWFEPVNGAKDLFSVYYLTDTDTKGAPVIFDGEISNDGKLPIDAITQANDFVGNSQGHNASLNAIIEATYTASGSPIPGLVSNTTYFLFVETTLNFTVHATLADAEAYKALPQNEKNGPLGEALRVDILPGALPSGLHIFDAGFQEVQVESYSAIIMNKFGLPNRNIDVVNVKARNLRRSCISVFTIGRFTLDGADGRYCSEAFIFSGNSIGDISIRNMKVADQYLSDVACKAVEVHARNISIKDSFFARLEGEPLTLRAAYIDVDVRCEDPIARSGIIHPIGPISSGSNSVGEPIQKTAVVRISGIHDYSVEEARIKITVVQTDGDPHWTEIIQVRDDQQGRRIRDVVWYGGDVSRSGLTSVANVAATKPELIGQGKLQNRSEEKLLGTVTRYPVFVADASFVSQSGPEGDDNLSGLRIDFVAGLANFNAPIPAFTYQDASAGAVALPIDLSRGPTIRLRQTQTTLAEFRRAKSGQRYSIANETGLTVTIPGAMMRSGTDLIVRDNETVSLVATGDNADPQFATRDVIVGLGDISCTIGALGVIFDVTGIAATPDRLICSVPHGVPNEGVRKVFYRASGTPIGGLTDDTVYWVRAKTDVQFEIYATALEAGAQANRIDLTGSITAGTHELLTATSPIPTTAHGGAKDGIYNLTYTSSGADDIQGLTDGTSYVARMSGGTAVLLYSSFADAELRTGAISIYGPLPTGTHTLAGYRLVAAPTGNATDDKIATLAAALGGTM